MVQASEISKTFYWRYNISLNIFERLSAFFFLLYKLLVIESIVHSIMPSSSSFPHTPMPTVRDLKFIMFKQSSPWFLIVCFCASWVNLKRIKSQINIWIIREYIIINVYISSIAMVDTFLLKDNMQICPNIWNTDGRSRVKIIVSLLPNYVC